MKKNVAWSARRKAQNTRNVLRKVTLYHRSEQCSLRECKAQYTVPHVRFGLRTPVDPRSPPECTLGSGQLEGARSRPLQKFDDLPS